MVLKNRSGLDLKRYHIVRKSINGKAVELGPTRTLFLSLHWLQDYNGESIYYQGEDVYAGYIKAGRLDLTLL